MVSRNESKTEEVSVVIPNYNGADLLKNHLPKVIKAAKNKKNNIVETIVIDDASSDESVSILKNVFPQVRLIQHRKNRGFSAAVNTGARSAKGNLLCLLNTDVSPSVSFLEAVLPHFADPLVFAVSLHESGYGWAKGSFKEGFVVHESVTGSNKAHETFWVSGGSGVFRRDRWMKLQGMDEKLLSPFYWEDVDLSYRAAKRGWKLKWEPKAKVTHEHEKTMRKLSGTWKSWVQQRNELLFIWKNITSSIMFRKHVVGLTRRILRHPGYAKIVFMALMRIKIVVKRRKREIRESRVSDEAIFARF
jgi:GT2 family glycosyltransferase